MNIKIRSWLPVIALASALVLTACGGGGGGGGGGASSVNVSTAGEQLQFAPVTLSATANQATTVNFKDASAAQQHNFVIVKGGDDVAAKVDEAGATAGAAAGYIPSDPNIAASVKLLNGGETGTASFTLPAGTYTYLCTFPGHYIAGMKGVLTVK